METSLTTGTKTAETASLANGGLLVQDSGGVNRKVGFRNPTANSITVARAFEQSDEQTFMRITGAGVSLTVDALQAGTQIDVLAIASGFDLIEGVGQVLSFLDGSGVQAPVGNRTIARGSVIHLSWTSAGTIEFWGNGIT